MASPLTISKNIIRAIDLSFGAHVVIAVNEFFGKEGYPVKMYIVKDSFYDGHTWVEQQLFKSTSSSYVTLFCRDLLFSLQGKNMPEPANEGYANVFAKNKADEAIQYIVSVYGNRKSKEEPTAS